MGSNKMDRRNFMTAAAAGVGAVAFRTAAADPKPAAAAGAPVPAAPTTVEGAGTGAAAPKSPPMPGGARKLDEVLAAAREKLYPRCRVCPECDGEACAGEVPGMGGIGSGAAFKNNIAALRRVRLRMRSLHDAAKPDFATTLFGQKVDVPFLIASLGGTTYNMGGKMTEEDFIASVLGGAAAVGSMALVADGVEDPIETYKTRLDAIARFGKGIGVVKPRDQQEVLRRIRLIEESGAVAVAMDIDAAGRAARAAKMGQVIEPKTPKQLREMVRATRLPFILKGVMTPEEAQIAIDVGAGGIVVSNHGGRVLDHTPGTAEVLPAIVEKVKGKLTVLADGGVRHGADVLKLLALGADAVLIGRPVVRGAHGGGAEGVQVVLQKIRAELAESMILTGVRTVRKVGRDVVSVA